ncbi:MAG: sortase, partial [Chloroflexota bacterium]
AINGGLLNLIVNATNSSSGVAFDEFTITIFASGANTAPVLRSLLQDQTAIAGTSFSFTTPVGFIQDLDGDTLTYSAELASGQPLPSWLSFTAGTQTFSGTAADSDQGALLVRVTADDGQTHTVSDIFLIGVSTADLKTLTLPLTPAGSPALGDFGKIIQAPAPIPADSHYYVVVNTGISVPLAPDTRTTLDLSYGRDIKVYDGSGSLLTSFNKPATVCFKLPSGTWDQYSPLWPVIGTTPDLATAWSLLPVTLHASTQQICTQTAHFSLFDLFFTAPVPTVEISSTSINPSVTGQPYTVNFSVTHAAASPSGTVSVEDGSGATCSGTLSSGLGSCLLTSTSAGSKTLTASYEGDISFKPASATRTQTVNKASTSTSFSEAPDPTLTGQPYTISVTVAAVAPGVGIPSGSVIFEDDDGNTCTVAALSAGKGSCSMATYRTGTAYTLQGNYAGDGNFGSSVSTNNHVVTIADTTTTIASQSPNPSTLGERVTFSAKVEAVAPAGGAPTGTVNFMEGSLLVCSTALASGLGSCTNTTLSMGDHHIIAVYSGMSNSYTPSSSASVMHRIQQISLDDNKSSTNFTRVGAFSTAAGTAPYTYSLQTSGTVCSSVNGSGNDSFNISADLLQRNSDTPLGTYAICVQSQDSIGGIVQQGFSIIINAPPVLDADSLDHKSVSTSENLVGTLTSSAGQDPQVLSLESSGPVCNASNSGGNEYFELNGNKLLRKSGTAHGEYAVCVQVKDAEAELAQYSYKITVTQAPTNLDLSRKTTSILQTLVGKFSVEDGQSPFSFSLQSSGKVCNASNGSDNSAFEVNSNQLERLPETGVGVYQVCAQAEDANNGLTQKEFTLNVTRAPSDLQLSNLTVSTAQSIVGIFNTLNGQVPFIYSLQNSGLTCNANNAAGNTLFEIEGNALRRLSSTPIGNYTLCLQTQDANGELFEKHFDITVTNGSSLPTDWTASLTSNKIIDGDAPGTLVGTVISSLEKASFALADPAIFPQSGHFTLTADGQLKLKISANRNLVPFYSIRIKVTAPTTGEVRYLDEVIQVMKNGVPAGAFAMKDSGELSASGNVEVDVLANDKLSTGATSWVLLEIVKYPEHGTARIGSIIYAAAPNFIGTDSVSYRACDNLGYCVLGQVAFSVNAVGSGIPKTGFAAGQVTRLPVQPAAAAYAGQGDLSLEIPSLKVKAPIVGVPVGEDGWDLTWLGKDAGWLAGSAYPSWDGNSVLTGHLYNADGKPGIFMNVNKLVWGDQLIVHLDGKQYIYEVREILQQVDPGSTGQLMTHKESPWLTLVTCQGYNADNDTYRYRVIVRAVLVGVK